MSTSLSAAARPIPAHNFHQSLCCPLFSSGHAQTTECLQRTSPYLVLLLTAPKHCEQSSYLHITHNALGLNPYANIDLDLHTVEQAYTLARADRASRVMPEGSAGLAIFLSAVACHHGDFLVGFSLGDAPGFDDWSAVQREVWRRRLGFIMDRLSEIQFASGEFAGAAEKIYGRPAENQRAEI